MKLSHTLHRPIHQRFAGVRTDGGFALVVAVLLLACLVLLLTSLAAFTQVESQVAGSRQAAEQARQNAVMALGIAIGQLQKYTGPDARVTAQANVLGATVENPWFTGVWDAGGAGGTPLTWLVSGNEAASLRITPATALTRTTAAPEVPLTLDASGLATNGPDAASPNRVLLVGAQTAALAGDPLRHGAVVVPGVPLTVLPPGFNSPRTVGRYAWWVGDQGVKASLGLPDRSGEVTYAPWNTLRQRQRLRQQLASAPAYFRNTADERAGFDPLAARNASALSGVVSDRQLAYLEPAAPGSPLAATLREQFHACTGAAFAVLANTRTDAFRGLMRDLSLAPGELGAAFAAYAGRDTHLEVPASDNTAVPPITSVDSPRRRHRITGPVVSAAANGLPAIEFKVAPVLTDFLLQFKVQRGANGVVTLRSRLYVALWNPYSAALVPPSDLSLEITGLPAIVISGAGGSVSADLQSAPAAVNTAGVMTVNLPFTVSPDADRASWLPGRVYGWTTPSGSSAAADLSFYFKNLSVTGWTYRPIRLPGADKNLRVAGGETRGLTVRLLQGGVVLAESAAPAYPAFVVPDVEAPSANGNWVFGFGFRLKQPSSSDADRSWLTVAGADFRRTQVPALAYGAFNEHLGPDPAQYVGTPDTTTGVENFLLLRTQQSVAGATQSRSLDARTADNDAPLFELPRLPVLSLGELQHLVLPEHRPFAIGNSWGGSANAVFDRFFFSGVAPTGEGPDLARGQPLPNWNLRPVDTRTLSTVPWSLEVLRDGGNALSSRRLLQAGGFNVNSARAAAWRAVLSGVRFPAAAPFVRAVIDNGHGAVADAYTGSQPAAGASENEETLDDPTLDDTRPTGAPGPAFCRFPQTAQETYFWGGSAISSQVRKAVFRYGVRGGAQTAADLRRLTTADLVTLAEKIEARVREHASTSGPFRSLEEFLSPIPAWNNRSLLEQAIADARLNPPAIQPLATVVNPATDYGLSSLTLTQADLLTALAPFLRVRSDTFLVRAFGESLSPATGAITGRAWCEAVLQRFPTPADSNDDWAQPAQPLGRRYKIISFRWLTANDI
jgi:hypothetical protein